MTNPIQAPTTHTTTAPSAPEATSAPKAASLGVTPDTLAGFSPTERDAAEQMLAAYRAAIGRNARA